MKVISLNTRGKVADKPLLGITWNKGQLSLYFHSNFLIFNKNFSFFPLLNIFEFSPAYETLNWSMQRRFHKFTKFGDLTPGLENRRKLLQVSIAKLSNILGSSFYFLFCRNFVKRIKSSVQSISCCTIMITSYYNRYYISVL